MHANFRKTFLPNWRAESKFPSCPKRKPTLDQLDCFLNGRLVADPGQQMEMVGHDHKFVEKIFPQLAIVIEHIDQERRSTLGLQKCAFLRSGGGDKERALIGDNV